LRPPSIFITIHASNSHTGLPDALPGGNRLYKYSFKGQVYTAQDFYEARNKAGLSLPDTLLKVSHYMVRLWQWDDTARDYAVEILNDPGHQLFNVYDEALVCYNTLTEFFPDQIANDMKLNWFIFTKVKAMNWSPPFCPPPSTPGNGNLRLDLAAFTTKCFLRPPTDREIPLDQTF